MNATPSEIKQMKRLLRNERRSGVRPENVVRVPLTGGDWLDRYLATKTGSIEAAKSLRMVHDLGLALPSRERQVLEEE